MSTRILLAATALTIFAGAAAAEGESRVDYTNMYSSTTRAQVTADMAAYNNMHDSANVHGGEAYGRFNPQASMSDTTRAAVMAEAINFRNNHSYVMTNEAYNGVTALDSINREKAGE